MKYRGSSIVKPAKPKPAAPRKPESLLDELVGRDVEITLKSGRVVRGRVLKASKYELMLPGLYVLKHAIETVKPL